jgi:hypothetical protein
MRACNEPNPREQSHGKQSDNRGHGFGLKDCKTVSAAEILRASAVNAGDGVSILAIFSG